jgi:hypothetical protein
LEADWQNLQVTVSDGLQQIGLRRIRVDESLP